MAFRPFIYNFATGRAYYGSALEQRGVPQDQWTSEQQRPTHSTARSLWATTKFGAGLTAIGAAGFIPTRGGGNVWDYYLKGIRGLEEYSPGGVFRTLGLSTIFSPFTSAVRNANLFISPKDLANNPLYREVLLKEIGEKKGFDAFARLSRQGVTFRNGKLFWGETGEVALPFASAMLSSGHGAAARIGAARARMLGVDPTQPLQHFLGEVQPKPGVFNPAIGGLAAQIIGGRSRAQFAYRYAGSIGTEMVERFNRLLDVPFDTRPFSTIFGRTQDMLSRNFGVKLRFGVEKSGGLRMLGKLGMKYGLGLGGIVLGYQTADWMMRNSSVFDGTVFEEGLTTGLATAGVGGWLGASRLAEVTGLHALREKQEEIAPGSTDPQKLLAFPLMGAAGMGLLAYGLKVSRMAKLQWTKGVTAAAARETIDKQLSSWTGGPVLQKLGKEIATTGGLYSRNNWVGEVFRRLARPGKEGKLIYKLFGEMTPIKAAMVAGGAIGLASILPFLPGALVPGQRPDELRKIYSGEQEVAVRKGRWWSFGRTPYEGTRIMYFRPHWYPRMRQRSYERSLWNEQEGNELTPLQKLFRKEFTYGLEREHYYDRPYPVTSLPFEDVPLIGPLLANTLGRFIKPPKLMHTEEWQRGDGSVKAITPRFGERVATEMGQSAGGIPVSPHDPTQTAGEQIYRMTEMVGLPGFLGSVVKEKLTGSQDYFDQRMQLESARRMHGMERWFWDQELGDMFMTNEALRRLYPHRRRQIDLYNPIRNKMPDWLPGPGDKAPDFLHGDPYTKVQEGELRLPGKGYEARFPELRGASPEEYPDIHKFKILADIAPYSAKFDQAIARVRHQRTLKDWTLANEQIYQTTLEQIRARKKNKEFQEYQYLSPTGNVFETGTETSNSLIAEINKRKANGQKKPGVFQRAFGGYWEALSHNAETAFDQLTFASPGAKLVHQRTAIESYERDVVYGSEAAFWQRPWQNFIKPFGQSVAHAFGWNGVPEHLKEQRELDSYFDTLKYVKYARLANVARHARDWQAVEQFEEKKNQTLFGVNPFTRDYGDLLRALPRKERDYFAAFEKAGTESERRKILDLVPENEKALYVARWKLNNADEIRRARKAGLLTEDQLDEANKQLSEFYDEAKHEGMPTSKELFGEYTASRERGENYADWYRRTYLLPNMPGVPGADWVGWHPSVDLEDIKLKVVQAIGEDMHDYNLWESREKALPYKPYVDEGAVGAITEPEKLTKNDMRSRINEVMRAKDLQGDVFISSAKTHDKKNQVDVKIEEDRTEEAKVLMSRMV